MCLSYLHNFGHNLLNILSIHTFYYTIHVSVSFVKVCFGCFKMADTGWAPPPTGSFGVDDQWIMMQEKTFTNWINEQLKLSGRSIQNITTDLCDGVCLVALVEALQFRKIGKVYTKTASQFQMLQNVSLALKAVTDDHVKLVNLGE